MGKNCNNKESNKINLTTLLKSISYEDADFYDYFIKDNRAFEDFKSEFDCFYNDNKTSTELVVDDLIKKFRATANFIRDERIGHIRDEKNSYDQVTFNMNYGLVGDPEFFKDYKRMFEFAESRKKKAKYIGINLQNNKKIIKAKNSVIRSIEKALKVYNDNLENFVFSNLVAFRILSVDYSYYMPAEDKKNNEFDFGQFDALVRHNPSRLEKDDEVFIVNLKEFMKLMYDEGFEFTNSIGESITCYKDFLEGFKNGEYFKITGDVKLLNYQSQLDDNMNNGPGNKGL